MLSTVSAATGRILISEPFMMDPNFKRSVVLLTEYAESGAIGFVLNHKSEYVLGDLVPDMVYIGMPVYIGGPVAQDTLHFVHRIPEKVEGGIHIGNGIYWGGDIEQIKLLMATLRLNEDESEVKFFIGYSGWTPEQLDDELRDNAWIVADKFDLDAVFDSHPIKDIWKQAVINLGQRYAHIANFPENPELN